MLYMKGAEEGRPTQNLNMSSHRPRNSFRIIFISSDIYMAYIIIRGAHLGN